MSHHPSYSYVLMVLLAMLLLLLFPLHYHPKSFHVSMLFRVLIYGLGVILICIGLYSALFT